MTARSSSRSLAIGVLSMTAMTGACSKSGSTDHAAPAASAAAASSSASRQAGPARTDGGAGAEAASAKSSSFAGTYTLAPATITIGEGKDYARVKQAKDDPSKLVGSGAMSLEVAPDGRVSGIVDSGPASPAIVDGTFADGEIRGMVRRKDPTDDGLVGTVVVKVDGASAEGKLSMSESNAAVVRSGAVSLKRK